MNNTDEGYELFGIPISDSVGDLIYEVFYEPSWTAKLVWIVIGMVIAASVFILSLVMSYS